jgi:hypothetical protein
MEMIAYKLKEENLRKKDIKNVARNFLWYNELTSTIALMRDIPYVIIKGEILSLQAYGGLGFRSSGDVDILVSRNDLSKVKMILEENGFEEDLFDSDGNKRVLTRQEQIMFKTSHQVVPYIKLVDGKRSVPIDINVDIFWGEYSGFRVNIDEFLSNTNKTNIYGLCVNTLPIIKHFIVLCLHHYREMNAPYDLAIKNPFKEKMFEDVYRLYKQIMDSEMNEFTEFVFSFHLKEVFYYLLYYTSIVFNDDDIKKQANVFKTPEGVTDLDYFGLTSKEKKQWLIPFSERMNHKNIFEVIKPQLTQVDIYKINAALSIFN